ncbi:MAG: T9SS type A sorting domain-containing protein, partial [Bacteroidetes bacterium]|nr:T9SS type A sorting domain-containing protein [Bacteroidota bacterium]
LWERIYYVKADMDQYIYDIKATSDNGYIFCGSAVDSISAGNFAQKSWIVKTDCFGCDSLLCYFPDTLCYFYDCQDYPIDAYFISSADTIDLAYENSISFTNPYGNATARHWDFGDGEKAYTDSLKTHTFTAEGHYTVSLKIHHASCNDVFSREVVVVNSLRIDQFEVQSLKFKVVPNPATNYVSIQISNQNNLVKQVDCQIKIFDLYGKAVIEKTISGNDTQLDLSSIPAGIYFCALMKGNEFLGREKMVVVK